MDEYCLWMNMKNIVYGRNCLWINFLMDEFCLWKSTVNKGINTAYCYKMYIHSRDYKI